MPMVQGAMADAVVAFGALDALAVTVGPGAYTGVRIGLAAARGLALAGGLPLVGVTTLEAVACAMHDTAGRRGLAGRALVVALETKRADIYLQAFAADLKPLGEPMAVAPEAATLPAGPIAVAGDGAGRLLACLGDGADAVRVGGPRQDFPDAAVVAAIAAARIAADEIRSASRRRGRSICVRRASPWPPTGAGCGRRERGRRADGGRICGTARAPSSMWTTGPGAHDSSPARSPNRASLRWPAARRRCRQYGGAASLSRQRPRASRPPSGLLASGLLLARRRCAGRWNYSCPAVKTYLNVKTKINQHIIWQT